MEDLLFIVALLLAALAADGGLDFPYFKKFFTNDLTRRVITATSIALVCLAVVL